MNTLRPRRGGGIASSSFILFFTCIGIPVKYILFVTQLPSLERWALLPFLGFPTLTCLFFLNLYIRNLYNIFLASVGTFPGSFFFFFFLLLFLYLILG